MTSTPDLADDLAAIAGEVSDARDAATLREASALLASLGDLPAKAPYAVRITLDVTLDAAARGGFPVPDEATRGAFVAGWLRGKLDPTDGVAFALVHPR